MQATHISFSALEGSVHCNSGAVDPQIDVDARLPKADVSCFSSIIRADD